MKRHLILFFAATLFLTLGDVHPACGNDTARQEVISVTGTIVYIALEGGFYGFVADSGERYVPLNLEQQYKTDNAKVRIEGTIRKDVLTFTMWGIPLEIRKIERL